MRDHKLLLAGLILLLVVVFIGIFTWLWTSNLKNADPLPIMSNDSVSTSPEEDDDAVAKSTLHIQAEDSLKVPLDEVIVRFQSRYPNVDIMTSYVASTALLTIVDDKAADNESSTFIVDTDIIIADDSFSAERLAPLQEKLKIAQDKHNQLKARNGMVEDSIDADGTGQDILSRHGYQNIDGYQNEMSDLFKPNSKGKQATGELTVNVADAISIAK